MVFNTLNSFHVREGGIFRAPSAPLLEELLDAHVLLGVLLHDLGHSHLEVLLGHVHSPLSESIHTRFSASSLHFSTRAPTHLLCDLPQVDPPCQVHLSGVNLENVETSVLIRRGEFDFPVNATRSEQGGVKDVNPVCGHDHLDVFGGLEPIQLIQQFQHGPLNLTVAAATRLNPGGANGVDLVHEDDGGCVLPRHPKQLPHHPAALANELLDKFRSRNADESAFCVMSNCARKQGLASARGTVEQHSFGLGNSKCVKQLWMFHWQFYHLLYLLDLLVETDDKLSLRVDLHQHLLLVHW